MKGKKVLLVDDEEDFVSTLAERLQLRGIHAYTAMSGEEAINLVETEPPDVVFLDLFMPGLGGLEVLKRIKEKYPRIQVILFTGQGYTEDETKGMELGAFDYMVKPIMIEDLIEKMNEALKSYD